MSMKKWWAVLGVLAMVLGCSQQKEEQRLTAPEVTEVRELTTVTVGTVALPTLFKIGVLIEKGEEKQDEFLPLGEECMGRIDRSIAHVVPIKDADFCIKMNPQITFLSQHKRNVTFEGSLGIEIIDARDGESFASTFLTLEPKVGWATREKLIKQKISYLLGAEAATWVNAELKKIITSRLATAQLRYPITTRYLDAKTIFKKVGLIDESAMAEAEHVAAIQNILLAQKAIVVSRRRLYDPTKEILEFDIVYLKDACPEGIDVLLYTLLSEQTESDFETIATLINGTARRLMERYVDVAASSLLPL